MNEMELHLIYLKAIYIFWYIAIHIHIDPPFFFFTIYCHYFPHLPLFQLLYIGKPSPFEKLFIF